MTIRLGKVEALWRYPVSSVCGERTERAAFSASGAVGDRQFGIFDDATNDIVFPSRQKHWNLAPMISAKLDADMTPLFSFSGDKWLSLSDPALPGMLALHFGRSVSVVKYGTDIGGKHAAPRYQHSPIHLVSRQAMEALKSLLPESAIDERRFRPNIVVDFDSGTTSATPEYDLLGREFQIGGLRLKGTSYCGRCSFMGLKRTINRSFGHDSFPCP